MENTSSPTEADRLIFGYTSAWKAAYPGAHAGVLVVHDVINPPQHTEFEQHKAEFEHDLRARFTGQDRRTLLENPILKAYADYYRRFDKTYHVLLQLESIVLKGRPMPSPSPLVNAMFMAEMKSFLLTAGHDLDATRPPLSLDVAQGTESYVLLRGEVQSPKAGDMMIADRQGIISSVLYGPDRRTQTTAHTRNAVFTVYAPAGIDELVIERHLAEILGNVRVVAPAAKVDLLDVYG